MKIAKRLKRLIEIEGLPSPYLNESIIREEEWKQILSGQLLLASHQAAHLAECWDVPISYFIDYDKNNLVTGSCRRMGRSLSKTDAGRNIREIGYRSGDTSV